MTIKRSMVFIDAGNLMSGWNAYCKQRNMFTRNIDNNTIAVSKKIIYKKLINEIAYGTDFIRGYYYDAAPFPLSPKKQRFFDMLRACEITISTKPLRYKDIICKHCMKKDENVAYQKGVDVALVTDAMGLAFEKAYDIAIIVSGDNDFVDALNYIKNKGLKIWVVSFRASLGDDLMRVADKVIKLDDIFGKIID